MRAQLLIDRALTRLSNEDGAPRARAAAAWNAAVIANGRHDSIGAREHADRALALYAEIDNARNVALLRVVSAALRLRQPEQPTGTAALRDLERAMDDLHEAGSRVDFGYAHTLQAKAYLVIGDLARCGGGRPAGPRRPLGRRSAADRLGDAGSGTRGRRTGDVRARAIELFTGGGDRAGGDRCLRPSGRYGLARARRGLPRAGAPAGGIEALRRASDLAGATYNPMAVRPATTRSPPAADPARFGRVARLGTRHRRGSTR